MIQIPFSDLRWPKARHSRLRVFLEKLDRVVKWSRLVQEIEPHYPSPGNGRQPIPLEAMIRIRIAAMLLGANDRQVEELLIDCPLLCSFCHLDDTAPRPPDAETIGNFRRRLERAGIDGLIQNQIELDLVTHGAAVTPGKVTEPQWHVKRLWERENPMMNEVPEEALPSCARTGGERGSAGSVLNGAK